MVRNTSGREFGMEASALTASEDRTLERGAAGVRARFAMVSVIGAGLVPRSSASWALWLCACRRGGLEFTYLASLIARAVRARSVVAIARGLVTLTLYGGVCWGLSRFQLGVSGTTIFASCSVGCASLTDCRPPAGAQAPIGAHRDLTGQG